MTNCMFCANKTCPNWGIDMWSDCGPDEYEDIDENWDGDLDYLEDEE